MATTLFQLCQDGNLEAVREILDENRPDLEACDGNGSTALQYAVKAGNVQIVQELVSRGARTDNLLQQDHVKSNPEIANLLSSASQQVTVHDTPQLPLAAEPMLSAPIVDIHGGKRMPDGSISYLAGSHYPGQPTEFSMQPHQQSFPFQPRPSFFDPSPSPEQHGAATNESSVNNLPPPEVARMIPCKFFPNCRYAEKCLFAHPVAIVPASTNGVTTGPVSPVQPPVFYQPPSNYAYPPYGPPQPFYTMAPPMPLQYTHAGVPMPLPLPVPPPPPHMGHHVSDQSPLAQAEVFTPQFASQPQYFSPPQATVAAVMSDANLSPTNPTDTEPLAKFDAPRGQASETDSSLLAELEIHKLSAAAQPKFESPSNTNAADSDKQQQQQQQHRRQSFHSFLNHHSVPFHPAQIVHIDATAQTSSGQPFSRTKGIRRTTAPFGSFVRTEFGKRADRPACYFFARSACKHGQDCRFPHVLADGTDARGPNAGKSSLIDASRAPNRALAAKNARTASGNTVSVPSAASVSVAANVFDANASPIPAATENSTPAAQGQGIALPASVSSNVEAAACLTQTSSVSPAVAASTVQAAAKDTETLSVPSANPAPPAVTAIASPVSNTATTLAGQAEPASVASASSAPSTVQTTLQTSAVVQKPTGTAPNGAAVQRNVSGNKPHANGVNGQNIKAGHTPSHSQSGHGPRSGFSRPGHAHPNRANNGSSNTNHVQATNLPKKIPQRIPNQEDFPALNGQARTPLTVSPMVNATAKINFSAILSAPAPVRKPVEPKDVNGDDASDQAEQDNKEISPVATEVSEEKKQQQPIATRRTSFFANGSSVADFATVAQAKPVAV